MISTMNLSISTPFNITFKFINTQKVRVNFYLLHFKVNTLGILHLV